MRKTVPGQRWIFFRAAPVTSSALALIASAVLLCAVLLCAVLLSASGIAFAGETITRTITDQTAQLRSPPMPTKLTAKSATVIDAETGRALFSLRPNQQRLIASTTKIMTALVAISRTKPNEKLTATAYRAGVGESILGLKPGEKMTAQDLLKALMLESANDAADTFAVRTASSRRAFVDAMNRRARALGLRDTLYGNPIGLDVPRTYSTAHDLAKLTRAAMQVPRFSNVVGKSRATLRSGSTVRRIRNRNTLVGEYLYVDGVKTGHTIAAGYVLVGAAHKSDAEVISVVTGEPSEAARNNDSIRLLRFGRGFFKPVKPVDARRALTKLPIALQDGSATVYPARSVDFAVRDGEQYGVTLTAPKELEGPIDAGTRVGTATVTREGAVVAKVPVAVQSAVPAPPIQAVMLHELERLLPLIAFLLIAFMMGVVLLRRRRQAPWPGTANRLDAKRPSHASKEQPLPDELG